MATVSKGSDQGAIDTLRLSHGDVLFRQGEQDRHVYRIITGHLKLEHINQAGVVSISAVLGADEVLGLGLEEGEGFSQTAIVKGQAEIYRYTAAHFHERMRHEPALLVDVLGRLARRQEITDRRLHAAMTLNVRGRIAVTLHDLIRQVGGRCDHGHEIDVPLTQQELAELVGASRPVVSAELNILRREGLLDYTRQHICMNRLDSWGDVWNI